MTEHPGIDDHFEEPTAECWQCGGVGKTPGCFEDCCSGADCDPDDAEYCCAPNRCDVCGGKGAFPIDSTSSALSEKREG
jgi:hypothetical protein